MTMSGEGAGGPAEGLRALLFVALVAALAQPLLPAQAELLPSTKVSDLRRAAVSRPSDFGLQLRFAAALLRRDIEAARPSQERARAAEARRILVAVAAKAGSPLAARREVALLHFAEGRTEQGLALGRELLNAIPQDTRLALQVLRTLVREGRGSEAGALAVAWLAAGGQPSQGTLLGLISSLRRDEAFVAALEAAALPWAEGNQNPEVWVQLAILRLGIERPREAWEALHRAEALGAADLRSARRHPFAGRLLSDHPEPPGAVGVGAGSELAALKRAVAAHPKHLGLALRHARALERDGEAEAADAAYSALAKRAPHLSVALLRAAMGALERSAPGEALPLLQELAQRQPKLRIAHALTVRAAHATGDGERRSKALETLAGLGYPSLRSRELLEQVGEEGFAVLLQPLAKDAAAAGHGPRLAWQALALSVAGRKSEALQAAVRAQAAGMIGPKGAVAPVLAAIASAD